MTDKTAKERACELVNIWSAERLSLIPASDAAIISKGIEQALEAAEAPLIARVEDLEELLRVATESIQDEVNDWDDRLNKCEAVHHLGDCCISESGIMRRLNKSLARLKAKEQSK